MSTQPTLRSIWKHELKQELKQDAEHDTKQELKEDFNIDLEQDPQQAAKLDEVLEFDLERELKLLDDLWQMRGTHASTQTDSPSMRDFDSQTLRQGTVAVHCGACQRI